jgi:uridylate kinase
MGEQEFGQDISVIDRICEEVQEVYDMGIQVCLVVGGGNIYRGVSASAAGMERASADYIGMLATVMNAIALQNSFERMGVQTRVLSAIPMSSISETYIRRKAIRHMEKKRIVIFAAGTGNPFFTTDTAAALQKLMVYTLQIHIKINLQPNMNL